MKLAAEDYEKQLFLSYFASNGDARSQYNMGIIYRDGLGLERNSSAALARLTAAEQKHMANYAVGLLLRDGPDDVQQPERAILPQRGWIFRHACSTGAG